MLTGESDGYFVGDAKTDYAKGRDSSHYPFLVVVSSK
jgi:hypothetical protein